MPVNNRRSFLRKAGSFSATALLTSLVQPAWSRNLQHALRDAANVPPHQLAGEEEFWYYVQQSYTVSPSLINLNNGRSAFTQGGAGCHEALPRFWQRSSQLLYVAYTRPGARAPHQTWQLAGCDVGRNRHAAERFRST
jgi:hypothetical protein